MTENLFKKYDIPAPRYTSYPTVPYWSDSPTPERWIQELQTAFQSPTSSWSMYIHIPFCETLCTYCGCNTAITKNHKLELPYVQTILKEWESYTRKIPEILQRPIREIHLGGGTPTFLSPESLEALLRPIMSQVKKDPDKFEAGIEVDPRHTTKAHLEKLRSLEFNRISMGVQDYDPEVQRLVNRMQSFDLTNSLTQMSRSMGFSSVNHDLIYGLPGQSLESITNTAELTVKSRPGRIALYSYAHVPWIKAAQRLFTDADLPAGDEKRALYERARKILMENGYREIGMDHFALETDSLYKAHLHGELHRNFMGYTHVRTNILLGLGVSAISETSTCFHQNEKILKVYEQKVQSGNIPTLRGHLLTENDRYYREQILTLMTSFHLKLDSEEQFSEIRTYLEPLLRDNLITFRNQTLFIEEVGRPFLRIICMAFDQRLREKSPGQNLFSKAI